MADKRRVPTLLLADDSVTIQRVVELTFADQEIDVVTVSDGDEAIAALEKSPTPDIVLADVGMPGRSGYAVARYIRNTPALSHVPVLLLTGAFEPVDQEQARAVGCDGVLAKPFEPQLMVTRVRELLERPATSRGGVQPDEPGPPASRPSSPGTTPPSEYFDRLDRAFASLTGEPAPVPEEESEWEGQDWSHPTPNQDSPQSYGSPRDEFEMESEPSANTSAVAPAPVEPPSSTSSPVPAAADLPPLADAFTSLLLAEQSTPPVSAPKWPTSAPSQDVSAGLVDEVTRRVLEQLTDRVVRQTVAEIVSGVAERLVQAEIDKIKSAL